MYSAERSGIPRPHDSRETPASASRNASARRSRTSSRRTRAERLGSRRWMHRARTPGSTRIDAREEVGRTRAPYSRSPRGRSDAAFVPPSEVEPYPRAAPEGGAHREFRDSGVLDAYTGQVRDGDFLVGSPASLQSRGDLTELSVDISGAQDPGLDGVTKLSETDALVESIRDDLVGVLEHFDIELLFVRAVGADGRNVGPGRDPFGSDERLP